MGTQANAIIAEMRNQSAGVLSGAVVHDDQMWADIEVAISCRSDMTEETGLNWISRVKYPQYASIDVITMIFE